MYVLVVAPVMFAQVTPSADDCHWNVIPLTAGFTAKFYVLMAAVRDGHQLWLVILAVICAAIGAFYYFKVIQAMYFKDPVPGVNDNIEVTNSFKFLLVVTAALIILLGILPGILIDWMYY